MESNYAYRFVTKKKKEKKKRYDTLLPLTRVKRSSFFSPRAVFSAAATVGRKSSWQPHLAVTPRVLISRRRFGVVPAALALYHPSSPDGGGEEGTSVYNREDFDDSDRFTGMSE